MVDTSKLKSLAREVSDLALLLAGLPAGGFRYDTQVLSDVEEMALRILKEASAARAGARPVGETSGAWRAVPQPGLFPR